MKKEYQKPTLLLVNINLSAFLTVSEGWGENGETTNPVTQQEGDEELDLD